MALAPCKNNERLMATRALFVKLGAREDEVSIEKEDGVENLVLRKTGKSQGNIVIGAHYDKVVDGCGAIDNWSGIVTLVHIYRSLKDVPLKKSLIFVAFGKEESGLLGSRAMVKAIKKEDVEQYCAMVNIDSLGMAAPQVPVNLSSSSLVGRVVDLAQRMKIPFNKVIIDNAMADSISFISKKIPAIPSAPLEMAGKRFCTLIKIG
jgi:Zn-dependent M28 family amino/carboxypeptidase